MTTHNTNEACCSIPPVQSDYSPKGETLKLGGLDTYVAGPKDAKKAIVVVYDIFGLWPTTKQGVDVLAEATKARVVLPDFFRGKPFPQEYYPPNTDEKKQALQDFFGAAGDFQARKPDLDAVVADLQKDGASKLGLMGFCWGGKFSVLNGGAGTKFSSVDIRRFTYADLKHITNDFKQIVGKGGFGTVYHGTMENGDEVAVKVLMETSIAESTDFLPEVQTLSKVHHKNLVTLQGYCQNTKCLALVYDFMPRGNLQQLLREGDDYSLTWEQRLHIALDSAQGLEYLHESCTPSIVHRDVKTANILLDKNLVGIIADFGLSRAFNDAHTHISTVAAGTLGYLDPEYHATFQLTIKTDVYSFGIVLLEIITGKPPVLMDPHTYHLPNWVRQKIAKGGIQDIVDKRLLDQYDPSSLQSVVDLAMNCVESAAVDRPSMTEVVSRLKVLLPTTPSSKVYASASSTKSTNDIMRKQFQLLISGDGNEESSSSFQSGYTNQSGYTSRMAELPALSGR